VSRRYAQGTEVSAAQTRVEIEGTVRRFGAKSFTLHVEDARARIGFEINGRRIAFELPFPGVNSKQFKAIRSHISTEDKLERLERESWRSLALLIKAKLAAVEAGIVTVEDEFLAQTIVPNQSGGVTTVSDLMKPQIEEAYARGMVPAGIGALALSGGRE
jgi:hypothetical protein